jgi:hypothetical protein
MQVDIFMLNIHDKSKRSLLPSLRKTIEVWYCRIAHKPTIFSLEARSVDPLIRAEKKIWTAMLISLRSQMSGDCTCIDNEMPKDDQILRQT